jgi:tetratricopeptide (TPR) repeat protein
MTENTGSRLPEHRYHRIFMHIEASRARLAVLAAVLAGAIGHAQVRTAPTPAPRAPPDTIARWLAAVQEHVPGELDAAAKTIATWPDDHLGYVSGRLVIAIRTARLRPWAEAHSTNEVRELRVKDLAEFRRLLKLGAILHADIAMLAPDLPPGSRPAATGSTSGTSMLMRDGEAIGLERNPLHWSIGRELVRGLLPPTEGLSLDSVQRDVVVDPFARHWFRATTAYLAGRLMLAEELAHTRQAVLSIPDDPVLLLLAGALHEHFGSPVLQNAIRYAVLPPGTEIAVGSAGSELSRARQRLERAIAADPSLAEAHIRLGRVLGYRGDHADALRALERGEELAVEPRWKYFAALFVGQELEQLKRYADAREAYARASALFPRAQSPRLALGRLATELGDRDAAATATRMLLSLPLDQMVRNDPWWSYEIRAQTDLDRWLAEYYEIARAVK